MKQKFLRLTLMGIAMMFMGISAQAQNTWEHAFGLADESYKDTSHSSGEYTLEKTWNGITWTAKYSGTVKTGKKYNISAQNVGSSKDPIYRMQVGSSNSDMTFEMSATFSKKIKSVAVTAYQTSSGSATIDIDVAGTSLSETALSAVAHTDATATTLNLSTPKSGKVTITLKNGGYKALYVKDIIVTFYDEVVVTSAGWASFSTKKALDFNGSGVTAYIATQKDASTITLSEIKKVPANTGIVVQAAEGTYDIPELVGEADPTTGNILKPWSSYGVPEETTYYTLAVNGTTPVFKKSSGEGTLAAGKSYLVVPAGARELTVEFENTTAIQNIERATVNDNRYYTLDGSEVKNPTKGIYIINGKKVVIR